jgi:hypothetical protein
LMGWWSAAGSLCCSGGTDRPILRLNKCADFHWF